MATSVQDLLSMVSSSNANETVLQRNQAYIEMNGKHIVTFEPGVTTVSQLFAANASNLGINVNTITTYRKIDDSGNFVPIQPNTLIETGVSYHVNRELGNKG